MSSSIGQRLAAVTGRPGSRRKSTVLGTALLVVAVVSACSTDNVLSLRPDVDIGTTTAALAGSGTRHLAPAAAAIPESGMDDPAPADPYIAGYPRVDDPIESAPDMTPMEPQVMEPEVMPADEVSCREDLKRLAVQYEDLAPIDDGGACRIDHPVKVSAIGGIGMKPAATLRCEMAATFAAWTRKELAPAARTRYFSGVKTIHQGSSYSCRRIRGTGVASEHSKGNALDIMRIELKNGRDIDVRRPGWFAFRQRGFLNTVRADGCDYFNTVLGPGYDRDHKDHFHFDIKARRNGHVACR